MNGLAALIREVVAECGPGASNDDVAALVEARLSKQAYRDAVHRLLCAEVARVRRLALKPKTVARPTRTLQPTQAPRAIDTRTNARADWLSKQLLIPGRAPVFFADATIADHLARIDYLKSLRAQCDKEILAHQQAIDRIRRSGAKCLADIKPRTAAVA